MNNSDRHGAIVALLLGLAFIAGGLLVRNIIRREDATLVETRGAVVENTRDGDNYRPVIEFYAGDRAMRFKGDASGSAASSGNTVIVRYNPVNPAESARVVDPLESLTPWAMMAMGALVVASGLSGLAKALLRRA